MPKTLTYNRFQSFPVKHRWELIEKALIRDGYIFTDNSNKRDRQIKRSLSDFQRKTGLTGNGVVDEITFQYLNLSED